MANKLSLLEEAANEVAGAAIFLQAVTADGHINPDEVQGVRATGRALAGVAYLLECCVVGTHLIKQILCLGIEHAPNRRLQDHIRRVQATLPRCPEEEL